MWIVTNKEMRWEFIFFSAAAAFVQQLLLTNTPSTGFKIEFIGERENEYK